MVQEGRGREGGGKGEGRGREGRGGALRNEFVLQLSKAKLEKLEHS